MEIINKYLQLLIRFFPSWYLYGFSVAFWSLIFPFHHLLPMFKAYLGAKKHKAILHYLLGHYNNVIERFVNKNSEVISSIDAKSTIWACWWDGYEAMPPIVKICYNSILSHAGSHPVQLISKHNFGDFVSIPKYIMKKLETGVITITSFSDILRANLLHDHGGIWMDVTIFVTKDISFKDMPFFTLKAPARSASVSLALFAGASNSLACINDNKNLQISRWSSFLLAGTKHSLAFGFIREIYYAYWKDHDDQIDYMLIDYIIALAYDYIPIFKELVDNVPCSSIGKFDMEKNLNVEFSEDFFSKYRSVSFHKLTWKKKFCIYTAKGKQTIYGYLLGRNK